MARIRSIHPGLWRDKTFVKVSMGARLLYIGILNSSDDFGAFKWEPIELKMDLLPMDNVQVEALLAELEAVDRIRRYEIKGQEYGAVRNFRKFQRPKKPTAQHPVPHWFGTYVGLSAAGTEPDDDEQGGGGTPNQAEATLFPPEAEPTLRQNSEVPQKSEKSPQMEDGGDKMEDGGEGKKNSLRSCRASPMDGFAEFYAAYPRKQAKGNAERAWLKAVRLAEPGVIVAAIRACRFTCAAQYIPLPASWLNAKRWEDQQIADTTLRAAGLGPDGRSMQPDETPNWLQLPGGRA